MKRGTWFAGMVLVLALVAFGGFPDVYGQAAKEVVIGYTGPLSGVAAEYGQDVGHGIEMAISDINAAGGITVKGQKYNIKLAKLDDMIDPTAAVNNCRRLRDQYKSPAIFNAVFNTIAPMAKINQEKGNEFIIMAYTSTPKAIELSNKLLVVAPPPFTVYVKAFSDIAWEKGYRKAAMVVTLGAYGDEWRAAFKEYWVKKGGEITIDKPANYYTETDFSAPLTAALATKPDVMLIGGPSATTALVIEQARGLGYKGGFILIDQAKMDYIANILKSTKLMYNTVGTAPVEQSPTEAAPTFEKKYRSLHKRMSTWEVWLNYNAMSVLARAMAAAGTVDDVYAIRAAFPKAFPLLGDKFPSAPWFGITPGGRMECPGSIQTIDKDGKYGKVRLALWQYKTEAEFKQAVAKAGPISADIEWVFFKAEKEQ